MLTEKQERNYWAKVFKDTETGCWLWTGACDGGGYGMVRIKNKLLKTHRVALELAGIDIPPRHVVDHSCHNTGCVNPAHLTPVTHRQNMQNRKGKSAGRFTSKFPGVSWFPRDSNWVVKAWKEGRYHHIGYFDTELEAFEAYKKATGQDIHPGFL